VTGKVFAVISFGFGLDLSDSFSLSLLSLGLLLFRHSLGRFFSKGMELNHGLIREGLQLWMAQCFFVDMQKGRNFIQIELHLLSFQ
jgi:hypothetical protein